jgi:hypothetical protein
MGGNKINNILKLKTILIIIILLLIYFTIFTNDQLIEAKSSRILNFNSYIDIEYNASILNEKLMINKSINIPITITFSTDLPEEFVECVKNMTPFFIPFTFRNKLIFNQSLPMQIINITILNEEEINWAKLKFTTPKIYLVDIPYYNQSAKIKTSLIISPFEEAPAQNQNIKLRFECLNDTGMVKRATYETEIEFTPKFTPTVEIKPCNSLRLVSPRKEVNFKIIVRNYSNKRVKINPEIIEADTKWKPIINPQFIVINSNESTNLTFSVISPYDFGLYDNITEFRIKFSTTIFPLQNNSSIGGPYIITLKVKNYGFSTPGFEFLVIFFILLILISIKRIKIHLYTRGFNK